MDIDLNPDAPPSPERTLKLAETFAECVRVMNHATRHHEALRYPSEADRLIREIASAASRLPQLLEQAGAWLEREQAAARIAVDDGGDAATTVMAARLRLDRAREIAHDLAHAVDFAASVTSHLAAVEVLEEGSDG